MTPKQSFVLALAAAAAAVGALLACSSSSSGGGAPEPDGGLDATSETGTDAMVTVDADAAEAAPCSDVPVPDGDVFTACLVQRCCVELTQCTKDCADYKSCVIACSQMDADPTCIDQCAMQHSNGQVELHNLLNCGDQKCTSPGDH